MNRLCTCEHDDAAHEHYREGIDCSLCHCTGFLAAVAGRAARVDREVAAVTSPYIPGRAELARCGEGRELWRNVYLLSRFARPEYLPPFQALDKRQLWLRPEARRARTSALIPQQRVAPRGVPVRSVAEWRRRSNR